MFIEPNDGGYALRQEGHVSWKLKRCRSYQTHGPPEGGRASNAVLAL